MTANESLPIYGHTRVAAVIGWPIEHSVSPPMHNAAFRALGMDWCYVAFAVPPERLAEAVAGARALGVRGMNVTVPHKLALLPLMDELTPAARAIGAANTIIFGDDGRLRGHNTDAAGFSRALGEAGVATEGVHALVLGAGGAARAVVYALALAGAQITLLNRTPERAEALATEFGGLNPAAEVRAGVLDAATPGAGGPVGATGGEYHPSGHVAAHRRLSLAR